MDEEAPTLMITPTSKGGIPKKSFGKGHGPRTLTIPSARRKWFPRSNDRNHSRSMEGIKYRSAATGSKGKYQGLPPFLVQSKSQATRRNQGRRLLLIKSGGGSRVHNLRPRRDWWPWTARMDPKPLSTTIIPDQGEHRDRLRDLVRHGAVVGSLIGFAGGV